MTFKGAVLAIISCCLLSLSCVTPKWYEKEICHRMCTDHGGVKEIGIYPSSDDFDCYCHDGETWTTLEEDEWPEPRERYY